MCVAKPAAEKCKMINRTKLGKTLKTALTKARVDRRLICGLFPAISHLENTPEEVVLCVLPTTRPGDATTHIQAVLLQAFCYENCIPVIQVDSSERLANYCGMTTKIKDTSHCNCAIITRDISLPITDDDLIPMSVTEQYLADFYECTLEEFPRPIIQLPI
ncbi:growth arrest and DNA damage-inducible protein GADD45 alpha [Euwallacea fornicatus]|uniref:growth arrest and DNA damage-inducible protein GADD45 alpha n=1 Tax=Euwallacea fornicatus TaxID=995702 RepID=UPI00338EBABF